MTLKEELAQALIHYDMHAVTRSYETQAALLLDLLAKREMGEETVIQIMAEAMLRYFHPCDKEKWVMDASANEYLKFSLKALLQRAMIVER